MLRKLRKRIPRSEVIVVTCLLLWNPGQQKSDASSSSAFTVFVIVSSIDRQKPVSNVIEICITDDTLAEFGDMNRIRERLDCDQTAKQRMINAVLVEMISPQIVTLSSSQPIAFTSVCRIMLDADSDSRYLKQQGPNRAIRNHSAMQYRQA